MDASKNYISVAGELEAPSAYFLQRLSDFDNMLVVFPSKKVPGAYVIARRRQFSAGLSDKAIEQGITQPDTIICLQNGLVPVCLMYKTGPSWNPDPIIETLKARDLWAVGGGDAAADLLEAQEDAAKAKLSAEIRDDQWNRSGDAYRSYKARTGQSTIRHNDTRKAQPRKGRRIYSNSPSEGMAGSGPLVTID